MKIFIDADGCPVVNETISLSENQIAEYYTENLHDAFINIQRLLNNYNTKINCLEEHSMLE